MKKIDFTIKDAEYIQLNQLLKITDVSHSGGLANEMISDGIILYNGEIETRKRKKVFPGDTVSSDELQVEIVVT